MPSATLVAACHLRVDQNVNFLRLEWGSGRPRVAEKTLNLWFSKDQTVAMERELQGSGADGWSKPCMQM